jgi:hypothetical protein
VEFINPMAASVSMRETTRKLAGRAIINVYGSYDVLIAEYNLRLVNPSHPLFLPSIQAALKSTLARIYGENLIIQVLSFEEFLAASDYGQALDHLQEKLMEEWPIL